MDEDLIGRLAALDIPREHLAFRDNKALAAWLEDAALGAVDAIGTSRAGQALFGVTIGHGPARVSIVAGCHADEPIGPMTAQAVPLVLAASFPELLERFTFHIVPQINPDGADANRPWFADPPDFAAYAPCARREAPGDDVEFGFGDAPGARPECRAAMDYLGRHGPYCAHFSLHGMPFAEGAWFLLCKEWVARSEGLMAGLEDVCRRLGVPLHDIDRKGEKGFTRIRPGFCTTPHSAGMREFFLERGDRETAGKFLPSSMEFAASLGGAPLCMVSEMPLFLIGLRSESLEDPVFGRLRADLEALRAEPPGRVEDALRRLLASYQVEPFPIDMQVRLQLAMIVLALEQAGAA